jgi:hypothetical protein
MGGLKEKSSKTKDFSVSHSDDGSSQNHFGSEHTATSATSSDASSRKFSAAESRQVRKIRALVYCVLLIAGAAVGTVVYITMVAGEDHTFESTFNGLCDQLHYVIHEIANDKMGSVGSIRTSFASLAIDHQLRQLTDETVSPWPYVTLSSYQKRAAAAKSLSGGLRLTYHPIIDDSNHIQWERYAAETMKQLV